MQRAMAKQAEVMGQVLRVFRQRLDPPAMRIPPWMKTVPSKNALAARRPR